MNQNNLSAIHTYDDNTETVIGDVPRERSTKACTFEQLPSQHHDADHLRHEGKGQPQTFDVWVWDNNNGQIKWT